MGIIWEANECTQQMQFVWGISQSTETGYSKHESQKQLIPTYNEETGSTLCSDFCSLHYHQCQKNYAPAKPHLYQTLLSAATEVELRTAQLEGAYNHHLIQEALQGWPIFKTCY